MRTYKQKNPYNMPGILYEQAGYVRIKQPIGAYLDAPNKNSWAVKR